MLKQKPINRNSKRSISLIVDSLLELMENRSFRDISISELTTHAGLVRNTFYAHFQTKEDVLSYYMFEAFKKNLQGLDLDDNSECVDIVAVYFEFWGLNTGFLELLYRQDLMGVLNDFESRLDELEIKSYIFESCRISDKAFRYADTVYVDTLVSIIRKWIKTGKRETPEELRDIFYELFSLTESAGS